MSKHYLHPLFTPRSIVVFGASANPESVGSIVFQNLIQSDYKGKIYAINPKYEEITGQKVYKNLQEINEPIDLAVIITPAKVVPAVIEACGQYGVKTAVIVSAGFRETGPVGVKLEKNLLNAAKRYGLRFLGPNCLGLIRPSIGLNNTFVKSMPKAGNLALVSQSGALCTAILDWAVPNGVGFSSVVSLGTSADLDFGEILDYLVSDPQTHGILLYVEGIHQARSFMSGLRAAARVKPVIVIKGGRHEATSRAAMSHSGALIGRDDAFDAALKRAGVVRVYTFGQLFAAAKTLASRYKAKGNQLVIITNGGGPGVMATDRAADLGIPLANLSQVSLDKLSACLPATWSRANPIDVCTDAKADVYAQALSICLEDKGVDAVLVILTPHVVSQPLETAKAITELAKKVTKPVLACWMGGEQTTESRHWFVQAHIPDFRTPEAAVEAFSYLSAYHRNQQLLLQTPASLGRVDQPDVEGARMIIESVLAERRKVLTEMESKALLGAFRIPVVSTTIARSVNEALVMAESIGFPVAVKINSHDISHKTDVNGVRLNLTSAREVRDAYKSIMQSVQEKRPEAHLDGVTIERMENRVHGREMMVGVVRDPLFGPVITFGLGGTLVEALGDINFSLPPLNRYLARTLIENTKASKLLDQFRHFPPADRESLEKILLRVSEMVCELPWIKEMDINPLIVDEQGAIAVDARIVVQHYMPGPDRYAHMAIHPYPTHLVSQWQLPDGTDLIIRPIRPEDAEMEKVFVRNLSDESRYFRFMQTLQELTPVMLMRFTQIDYDREMALISVIHDRSGRR
jgi:acetyltransferase